MFRMRNISRCFKANWNSLTSFYDKPCIARNFESLSFAEDISRIIFWSFRGNIFFCDTITHNTQ